MPDPQTQPSPGASAALNSPAAGGDFMKALTQQDEKTQAIVGQEQKEMAPAMDQANMALNQPRPQAPQLQAAPKMPDFQAELHKNGEEFVLTSTLIAGLVGAFTRNHVTTALNAFGAAVKGFHQGQLEAADQSFKEWKANSDAVEKNNKALLDQYRNVFEDRKASIDEASNRIALIAAKYKDPLMAQAASAKNMGMMATLYERLTDANNRYEIANDKLEDQRQKWQDSLKDATDASGIDPKTPEGQQKLAALAVKNPKAAKSFIDAYKFSHPEESGAIDEAGIDFAATMLRKTGVMPSTGMGGSDMKAKIINRAAKQARELGETPDDVIVAQSDMKADRASLQQLTKMSDAAISFENTASKNFKLALSLAPKGVPTNWGPWVNKWVETGDTGAGNPDVPKYVTALLTGANEYAKIMQGSTGAQGATVDARREAEERFSPYLNKNQIDGVIQVAQQDMDNRTASLQEQRKVIEDRIRNSDKPAAAESPPAPVGGDAGWSAKKIQ